MSFDIKCKKEEYYAADDMYLSNTLNDCGYTKCGELYVLFRSFDYVFLCFICKNHIKYETINDLVTHVKQKHYGYQTEAKPFNSTSEIPVENIKKYEESDVSASGDEDSESEYPETALKTDQSSGLDFRQEIKIEQSVDFLPSDDENMNDYHECSNQPSLNPLDKWIINSDSPFNRICITEFIDLYRKCIGLWHTKTERDTPNEVKAAAFSYLDERFSAHYPSCRQNDSLNLLTSMKNCFLKKVAQYIQTDDDRSEGWYLSHLTFFLFAHSEELSDEEFKDFNCASCEYKADGLTRSVDLWNHIIADHLKIPKIEPTSEEPMAEEQTTENPITRGKEPTTKEQHDRNKKVLPLQWPDKHILEFIEMYQKHECLWNGKSKDFYNRSTKANAYADLIQQFSMIHPNVLENEEAVNHVINHLRVYFFRVGRKCKSMSKTGKRPSNRFLRRLKIYEKLSFLKEAVLPTNRQGIIDYTCEICGQICSSRKKFMTHTANQHPDERYECGRCDLIFKSQLSGKIHRISHGKSDDEPYTCSVCDEFCKNPDGLDAHIKIHLKSDNPRDRKYICKYCDSKFNHRSNLCVHLKKKACQR